MPAWGDVPPELACLNALEEKMIALYVCNTKIVICPLGQTARIGGTAYVMNDIISNLDVCQDYLMKLIPLWHYHKSMRIAAKV